MSVPPPEGTITFLFTDLEGSTERWESHPDAMRDAVAAHDEMLRGIFERHAGYVFTTAGDSFAVAFARAGDAARAARAVQREMTNSVFDAVGELLVRIGIHTGSAELRDGDYFGHDVNLAARVMASGPRRPDRALRRHGNVDSRHRDTRPRPPPPEGDP